MGRKNILRVFSRTAFPALFFVAEKHLPMVSNITSRPATQIVAKANRFYARIKTDRADTLSNAAQASPFQTLVALFGLYLNQLLGRAAVDILVPVVNHRDITQLNQIESSSNVIPVSIVTPEKSVVSAIAELRNNLLNGLGQNLSIEQIFCCYQNTQKFPSEYLDHTG